MHPEYEAVDEFDPQLDFAQFFKETKTHVCHHKTPASDEPAKQHLGGRRKPNKSWKTCTSIFLWLKADKKNSKSTIVEEQPPGLKPKSKTPRAYVSGSIKGCTTERPTSGPILGLFNFHQRKTTEDEFQMPYVSLGRSNTTPSYGPVYLVT